VEGFLRQQDVVGAFDVGGWEGGRGRGGVYRLADKDNSCSSSSSSAPHMSSLRWCLLFGFEGGGSYQPTTDTCAARKRHVSYG